MLSRRHANPPFHHPPFAFFTKKPFLENKDLTILQWLFEIQQNSINRIFNKEQELRISYSNLLIKKRNKHLLKYLIIALNKDNNDLINNTINILINNNKLYVKILIFCIKKYYIKKLLIFIIKKLNQIRKII